MKKQVIFYTKRIVALILICSVGFGIGTFYPNFISKKNIEEKAVDDTVKWAKDIGFVEPVIKNTNNVIFVETMKKCIAFHNLDLHKEEQIPDELIIAMAVIESNWGTSRFAVEGNNLFGIRTWSKGKGMLPQGYSESLPWRVKSYRSKCESIKDYIKILNTKEVYSEFRKIRANQLKWSDKVDGTLLAKGLDAWSTTKDYEQRVINIIKSLRAKGKVD